MKFCEKLKSIFKSSSGDDKKDDDKFLKELRYDISNAKMTLDDFEKKFKKLIDSRLKKIHSMTEMEKKKENEMISLAFQVFNNFGQIYQVAPLIANKIKVLRPHLEDYQAALRKSTKNN